ncbi:sigma-70 family RNA polymerase sigma factor [uncultured Pseudodesulfovibrio sp.]|uniref:sigma-70 family RNA polymerase sigma factor n=1 Tax=uncultured Pseudodesulfovibrio sp. TaxID=2035858 RepID=UPI003747AD25
MNERISGLMPGVLARAYRMLGSGDEAQDVVQESLLIAFSRLDQLRDVGSFSAWLNAIVVSQCHRQLRVRGREISLESLGLYEPIASKSFDPSLSYESTCFRVAANDAILQLAPTLREVCQLYFESGYSVAEIAEVLSLKQGTVRKHLHTAKPLLADMLAAHMGEPAIKVGYLPISDHLLGMVAHRLNMGRNFRIHMKRFLSWSALASALRRGTINTAFIMAPLAMQLCNSGTPLKYIMDGHHDGSALTASSEKLQGKLVGVPGPFSTHRVLLGKLAMDQPGNWGNVGTADTNPSYVINSLKRQIIDAFFCAEPWSTKCVSEGGADVQIRSKDISPGHICCVVAVREDFSSAHPELVNDYVRTLYQARDKIYTDSDYCAATQAEYTGVPRELAARIIEEDIVTFDDLSPDRGRMDEFMQLALASGVLSSSCDLDEFVCDDFS